MSCAHDIWQRVDGQTPYGDWFLDHLQRFATEQPEHFNYRSMLTAKDRVELF